MKVKAQVSVEYIVLIALVLTFGLLLLAISGNLPSFSFSAQKQSAISYWEGASPIAILDTRQVSNSNTLFLVLQNKANLVLNVTNIKLTYGLKEIYQNSSWFLIFPGEIKNISINAKSCTLNQEIFYDLEINYSTQEYNALSEKGLKPIYIKCI
jgi:archaellum component FlaF (FlaF/FlaG flagellin family)